MCVCVWWGGGGGRSGGKREYYFGIIKQANETTNRTFSALPVQTRFYFSFACAFADCY